MVWVQSLVGELRSHKTHDMAKKKKKVKKHKEERQGRTLCLAQDNWEGTYVLQREWDKSILAQHSTPSAYPGVQ